VVVVGTAIESEMAGRGSFVGVGVEGRFVGLQNIALVIDFYGPMQVINGTVPLLCNGANRRVVVSLLGKRLAARRRRNLRRFFRSNVPEAGDKATPP